MTVALFGNDDSDAAPQTRLIAIVEDSLDPNGTIAMEVPTWDGVNAQEQDASAPAQGLIVYIVEDGSDSSLTVAMSVPFNGDTVSTQPERYVTIIEDGSNPESTTAVLNPFSSNPVYALLLQPNSSADAA